MSELPTQPSHLYKYQRLTAHSLASVLNDTVWLSKPTAFNDPFDCAITLSEEKFEESRNHAVAGIAQKQGISSEKLVQFNEEFFKDDLAAYEQLRTSLRSELQTIGILSLSAIPDHILMWSHYADHHKGFCIEYDCSEGTQLKKLATQVTYAEEIPLFSSADIADGKTSSFIDVAIFTKAAQWKYEQEWRLFAIEGGRSYQAPSNVTSLIFGARMSSDEKIMMHRSLRHKEGILFKQALVRDDRFGITITDYSV